MTEDQIYDLVVENIQLKLLRDHAAIDAKYAAQRKWVDIAVLGFFSVGILILAFATGYEFGVATVQEEAVERGFGVQEADMPNFKWKDSDD